jgi:hypothetical protein
MRNETKGLFMMDFPGGHASGNPEAEYQIRVNINELSTNFSVALDCGTGVPPVKSRAGCACHD